MKIQFTTKSYMFLKFSYLYFRHIYIFNLTIEQKLAMFYKSIIKNLSLFTGSFFVSTLMNQKVFCKQKKHQTFIWGNGYYQARPDALLQFQNFCPKHIKNLPTNLKDLKFGQYYQAGIDTQDNLYIWDKQSLDANFDESIKNQDQQRKNITKLYKNVKCVRFTEGFIWILTKNKEIVQFPIVKQFDKNNELVSTKIGNSRQVQPLRGSIQLQTGNDHIIALKQNGSVFAMGDDTYGQCGLADKTRNPHPPFEQFRVKYPTQVKFLKNIQKIAAGGNHCLALDKGGNLFGWGSNSLMQLSHQEQYSQMNSPLLCSFGAIKISKGLDASDIDQMAAGQQFSVLTTTNRATQSNQVFTFGGNLKGQLGVGQVRHLKDISRVETLSNYILKVKGKQQKVKIQQLSCGKNHCIALLNIGYIMEWGDNQYGQLGNKKRSCSFSPIVLRDFMGKKIVGVFAGQNSTGVIIEQEDKI